MCLLSTGVKDCRLHRPSPSWPTPSPISVSSLGGRGGWTKFVSMLRLHLIFLFSSNFFHNQSGQLFCLSQLLLCAITLPNSVIFIITNYVIVIQWRIWRSGMLYRRRYCLDNCFKASIYIFYNSWNFLTPPPWIKSTWWHWMSKLFDWRNLW